MNKHWSVHLSLGPNCLDLCKMILYVEFKAFPTTWCSPVPCVNVSVPCVLFPVQHSLPPRPNLISPGQASPRCVAAASAVSQTCFPVRWSSAQRVTTEWQFLVCFLRNFWILLSLQIEDEKIIFSIFSINLFIKWNSYDQLRKMVMTGWFVGFLFFLILKFVSIHF